MFELDVNHARIKCKISELDVKLDTLRRLGINMADKQEPSDMVFATAALKLSFKSASSAKAAYDALLAEADFSHRGGSSVSLSGKTVTINISADDPVSLRASLNSYLRLIHIIKTIEQDTDRQGKILTNKDN